MVRIVDQFDLLQSKQVAMSYMAVTAQRMGKEKHVRLQAHQYIQNLP